MTHVEFPAGRNLSVEAHMALNVPGPSFDAPWMDWFRGYVGWGLATLIAVLVIVTAVGAGLWVWGKMINSSRPQESGITGAVLSMVAAAIITVAGSAIMWATEIGPEWATF